MGNLIQTFPQNDNSDYMKKGVDYVTAGQKADTVRGERVTIEGGDNTASGNDAHAEGWGTTASGGNSHSEGEQTVASTYNTHAEGKMTTASARGAHSEGHKTVASGDYSHAEGYGSSAVAAYSHAEGSSKVSSTNGTYAHAEGQDCTTSASGAHVEGWNTEALGRASHAEGYGTIARIAYQHVQGKYNEPDTKGLYAHIVGGGSASYHRSNIHTLDWFGNAWYAGDVNAGRSNGLTDDTKLPTGADVISYLDSNMSSSKTITGNPVVITDAANIEAEEVIANIEPIQDLHGYDNPWVGGAGKNILPLTDESIKTASGLVWSGDSATLSGVTWTINKDTDGNVIGITANGTPTTGDYSQITIARLDIDPGTYTFSGISDGSSETWYVRYVARDSSGTAISIDGSVFINVYTIELTKTLPSNVSYVNAYIGTRSTISNKTFKPMVRLATETDSTFAPYSNICSISGLDSVEVKRIGKNLLVYPYKDNGGTSGGVTYTFNTDGSVSLSGTATTSYTEWLAFNRNYYPLSLKAGQYILSGGYSDDVRVVVGHTNSSTSAWEVLATSTGGDIPFELTYDDDKIGVTISTTKNGLNVDGITLYPMIRLASEVDSTFEPSQLEIHTTSLPQITYGGTLNIQTGELVVDRGYAEFDGSSDEIWSVSNNRFVSTSSLPSATYLDNALINVSSCNIYKGVNMHTLYANRETAGWVGIAAVDKTVYVVDNVTFPTTKDVTAWKTYLSNNPLQVCYQLATPQTYYLNSSQVKLLLNNNNISTNANEISVKYQPNNNLGEILTVSEEYTDRKVKEEVKSSKDVSGNPIIIEDSANVYANEVIANIEPIQNLHGYDYPWVGGAGKNILPLTVDGIKSVNTSAAWTGNSITLSGVTFTIQTDSDNNVIGILANGDTTISSGDFVALNLPRTVTLTGNYIINGCPAGGSDTTYLQRIGRTASSTYYATETGSGLSLNNVNDIFTVSIFVKHASNLVFKPMLRLATETDPTFEPYTNICPISALDSVEVKRIGKNLFKSAAERSAASFSFGGITCTKDSRNVFKGSGTTTGSYGQYFFLASSDGGPIKAGSKGLFIKGAKTLSGIRYLACVSETEDGDRWYPGIDTTGYYVQPGYYIHQIYIQQPTSGSVVSFKIEPQIEIGNQATEYEPCTSETHTISLPKITYGGTLNVQTGELVVDRVRRFFIGSDEAWYADSRWPHSYFTTWTNDSKYTPSSIGFGNYIQCNKYHGVAKEVWDIQNGEILFNVRSISGASASIIIKDENYSSIKDFRTSLSSAPLKIVYELATPQTYHLTPEQVKLLKGYNYITTNADTLDITYQVDNVLGEILSESEKHIDRVIVNSNNAGYHNSIYRGKYLGETVTSDQYAAIGNGTFYDLFIGDYWIINDITWRIAAFDYWIGVGGGQQKVSEHHVVIVPDQYLSNGAKMNDSSTTSGGYIATIMHTQTIPQVIDPIVENAFGSAHILVHSEMITDQVTNGVTTKYVQVDNIKSENMNEIAVYGSRVFGSSGYDSGNARGQLPLFRLNPDLMVIQGNVSRKLWWLRDIHNEQYFCYVNGNGYADKHRADNPNIPVRPYFSIKA